MALRAETTFGDIPARLIEPHVVWCRLSAFECGNIFSATIQNLLVGMGSGRETAKIHYWFTNENGEKVFENKDTIQAEFWGNAYANSAGELAHPFADKISGRIKNAKLK